MMTPEERNTWAGLINLLFGFGSGYVFCAKVRSEPKAFWASLIACVFLSSLAGVFIGNAMLCDELLCGLTAIPGYIFLALQYLVVNLAGAVHLRNMFD